MNYGRFVAKSVKLTVFPNNEPSKNENMMKYVEIFQQMKRFVSKTGQYTVKF